MPITLPDDKTARQAILDIGVRMYQRGFVAANDGNISCKTADSAVWATPSGVSKGFMREEDLVKMSLDGQVLMQGTLPPSSESGIHLRFYRENPNVGGVAHAHPPLSTAFAVTGQGLDAAVYPEAVVTLGVVPCLPYAIPGTARVLMEGEVAELIRIRERLGITAGGVLRGRREELG